MIQLICHLAGDYLFQSSWMAENKTKRSWPAFVHALVYSLCFMWLCWSAGYWKTVPIGISAATSAQSSFRICVNTSAATAGTTAIAPSIGCWDMGAAATTTSKWVPGSFRWLPWLVIFSTHFLIDRFRLARYVVWAKNWLGPGEMWTHVLINDSEDRWIKQGEITASRPEHLIWQRLPLSACPTGYPPTTPIWLSTWLLIIADNTLHLAINYAALRWL